MGFSLRLRGADKRTIANKVAQAAGSLAVVHLLDHCPRKLSGGLRQRIAMGRTIVLDPRVFLFAEPLPNPDAKLRLRPVSGPLV